MEIRTRRHHAIVYETCRPNLEKYKEGAVYRGILEWNNLDVNIRNIETFSRTSRKMQFIDQVPAQIPFDTLFK